MNTKQLDSDIILNDERRGATRRHTTATVVIGSPRSLLKQVPVIECTHYGARVVLDGKTGRGEEVNFIVKTDEYSLIGEGRVAWTAPLSNGRSVAGLEFITVKSVL